MLIFKWLVSDRFCLQNHAVRHSLFSVGFVFITDSSLSLKYV